MKTVLGLGLVAVALSFLRAPEQADVRRMDAAILEDFPTPQRVLLTAEGEEIAYTGCPPHSAKNDGTHFRGIERMHSGAVRATAPEVSEEICFIYWVG